MIKPFTATHGASNAKPIPGTFKSSMAVMNVNSQGWFESWMQGGELDQGLQEQQTEENLVQFEEDDKTRLEQALVRTSLTLV